MQVCEPASVFVPDVHDFSQRLGSIKEAARLIYSVSVEVSNAEILRQGRISSDNA